MRAFRTAFAYGLMMAGAWVAVSWDFALFSGMVAGGGAVMVASIGATIAYRARLRLWLAIVTSWLVGLGVLGLAEIFVRFSWPAEVLGLQESLFWLDGLRTGGTAFALAFTLRTLSLHYRALLAVEIVVIAAAVAAPVMAHRDGMIARPLWLADWFWQQGWDPVYAFLGLGVVGMFLVAGALSQARRTSQTLLALLVVLLVAGVLTIPLHSRSADQLLPQVGGGGQQPQQVPGKDGENASKRPSTSEDSLQNKDNQSGQSQRPVAVVVFHKDVEPFGGVYYFRHAAFSQFNGVRLVESTHSEADLDVVWRFPTRKRVIPGPPDYALGREKVAMDVALLTEHQRLFALTDAVELEPMANPSPGRFYRAYRVVSSVPSGAVDDFLFQQAGSEKWSEELWAHYTRVPEDPRYIELATRIDATLRDEFREDPMARALSVKQYLEETTIYSFKQKYTGDDPTAEFLFGSSAEDRKGYCVHIAHAAATLLRTLNIPARVSAGYAVASENLRGGSALLVKSGDAHAWVEIHLSDSGWVPIEIVPTRKEVEPASFDEEDLQRLLGEMARGEGKSGWEPAEPSPLVIWLKRWLKRTPWLLGLLVLGAYGVTWYRRWRPLLTPAAVRPAYRACLDRLAAAGIVREYGESRERFALRVSRQAPSFLALTEQLNREVLRGASTVLPKRAYRLGVSTVRELASGLPWWRRIGALVHPAPWWWAK
ncbi:MAG: transglutaminase domain-containing protein [Myxococcales bacterium]|nr:transglutaminase domain-containing protein [Myxococcales bacterium]